MNKPIHAGQLVKVNGGKYHGHGAQVRKIYEKRGRVDLLIAGKIVNLAIERVEHGK